MTRMERLHGRDWIVAPMVMLTSGVHDGSNGPLYYPLEELEKTPSVWNMKPIVVYHPDNNGAATTATDPVELERRQVGMVMHAECGDGKLRAEAWLERDRLDLVDPRILESIDRGQMVEVSTGLHTDNMFEPGRHEGQEYQHVARNYRPDHLAILPDKIGACSIKGGCGLLQQNELRPTDNALSHGNTQALIEKALREQHGSRCWITDVYPAFVVYEKSTGEVRSDLPMETVFYRQPYTLKKGQVELTGAPETVTPVREYRLDDGQLVGNTRERFAMCEKIDALIDNDASSWDEGDREFLAGQPDAVIDKIAANAYKPPAASGDDEDEDGKPGKGKRKMPPTKNESPAPAPSVDEYIDSAPPEIRDVLTAGIAAHNSEKATLIAGITSNESSKFTAEQLNAKGLEELQMLHTLAAQPEPAPHATTSPRFDGQAAPTRNAAAGEGEGLALPTMTFD